MVLVSSIPKGASCVKNYSVGGHNLKLNGPNPIIFFFLCDQTISNPMSFQLW